MKQFCSMSEAVREGAKLRPQAEGLFEYLSVGVLGSCAIGAAYEAMTGRADADGCSCDSIYRAVETAFPYILDSRANCPAGCNASSALDSTIIHLNDDHNWTREAIADWLESEEEKLGFVTVVQSESEVSKPELAQVV